VYPGRWCTLDDGALWAAARGGGRSAPAGEQEREQGPLQTTLLRGMEDCSPVGKMGLGEAGEMGGWGGDALQSLPRLMCVRAC